MEKKVALHNLGCKVNAYELEAMEQMLKNAGYEIVPFAPGADIYIINTCTVTNIADRKSRQMLHKAKKMNPQAVVVAAGCYAQAQKGEEIDEAIDIVLGNNRKQDLIAVLEEYQSGNGQKEERIDLEKPVEYEELELASTGEHTRAYLKVQDGCNQFCSYCIIPYVRGRVRSRKREEVIKEVERLVALGYQEFVLTGIHLSSYGIDCEDSLLNLIVAVQNASGLFRTAYYYRRVCKDIKQSAGYLPAFSFVFAEWMHGNFKTNESQIYRRRILRRMPSASKIF